MLVQFDASDIPEALTPGIYDCVVKDAKTGEYSTGTPYVNWTLETAGEKEARNNGRYIFYKTPTDGPGKRMTAKFVHAAIGEAPKGPFQTEQLMGRRVRVEVIDGVDKRTGEKTGYIEVKNVRPVV